RQQQQPQHEQADVLVGADEALGKQRGHGTPPAARRRTGVPLRLFSARRSAATAASAAGAGPTGFAPTGTTATGARAAGPTATGATASGTAATGAGAGDAGVLPAARRSRSSCASCR